MSIEYARKRRTRRAAALRAVASGRVPVREALRDGHSGLGTCPVHVVLLAAPGLGPEGVRKTLERARIWPLIRLGQLSKAQRQAILDNLPERVQ